MERYKAGSTLLMILFFTSTLCLIMLGVWRNALYTLEAALARMTHSQVFASTQGLLNVAIELSIENYEKLALNDQETRIEIPEYATIQGKPHTGIILLKGAREHLILRAQLKKADTTMCALRCHFSQHAEGRSSTSAWAIEAQS